MESRGCREAIAVERDSAVFGEPSTDLLPATAFGPTASAGGFTVIVGGGARSSQSAAGVTAGKRPDDIGSMSQALAIAHAVRDFGPADPAASWTKETNRTDIGESAKASAPADAETSRRRSSHP